MFSGASRRAVDSVFSMAPMSGSAACVMAASVVNTRSLRASATLVITGMLCGPATRGRSVSAGHWRGPMGTVRDAHSAVALSWHTTSRSGGTLYFV